MGASGWWYEVDYEEDVSVALASLQRRVFAEGDYYNPVKVELRTGGEELFAKLLAELVDMGIAADQATESLTAMREGRPPSSMDHVLALNAGSGTHSILDLMGVGDGMMYASPVDDATQERLFGTTRPTLSQVRAHELDLMELRMRWEGSYVVTYTETGRPDKIVFTGFSGD